MNTFLSGNFEKDEKRLENFTSISPRYVSNKKHSFRDNENNSFETVFRNSYKIYTDLFQDNLIEDTYTPSKRHHFMKDKGSLKFEENTESCSECHKPFETTFWFVKRYSHCHFCHNNICNQCLAHKKHRIPVEIFLK